MALYVFDPVPDVLAVVTRQKKKTFETELRRGDRSNQIPAVTT